MLAAHSVYDQYGKLVAICPDAKTANDLAWTLTMVRDSLYHRKQAIPDEILSLLDKPANIYGEPVDN